MMNLPVRKQIRLKEYDYSKNGAYFVTVCTHERQNNFGTVRRGDPCGRPGILDRPETELTVLGSIAEKTIETVTTKYAVEIPHFVIMPNHIHLIVILPESRATARVAPTLGNFVGAYKSLVTNKRLRMCKQESSIMGDIWQRGYYEHIIRNEKDYLSVWQYIDDNPSKWAEDEYYINPQGD